MASTKIFEINDSHRSLEELYRAFAENHELKLSAATRQKVEKCRTYLDEKMAREEGAIYGINTGFGSLYNVTIEGRDLERLQENLVRSHACGTGDMLPPRVVKLMILLKIQSLSYGHSGVRPELIEHLITFYNKNLIPKVYEQGSLGASGDLAPLAHISLTLMGEGELMDEEGTWKPAGEVLQKYGLVPITLKSKEGLALLNGTQFMLGIGSYVYFRAQKLSYLADLIGTLSLEAYDGRPEPFDAQLHQLRGHSGQQETAANVREFLMDSALIKRSKEHVQDPYSLRCMPQVHGATKDALRYIARIFTTELNSVTDNPTIFPDEDKVLSGGNFHGQPLALALDHCALALSELGNISERRTYLLVSGQRQLPPFLVAQPGLNSGLMIAQYTAAGVASQNKQLCTPASADSITSSNGQEDHVSMGANAATKLLKVVDNLHTILAIELLNASQALHFREEKTSPFLQSFLEPFRQEVPFIENDRELSRDIEKARDFIEQMGVDSGLTFTDKA